MKVAMQPRDLPASSVLPRPSEDKMHSKSTSGAPAALQDDIVAAINQQTSGTEFYGRSSDFVLLDQLLSQAHMQLSNGNKTQAFTRHSPVFETSSRSQSSSNCQLHARDHSSEMNTSLRNPNLPSDASQTPLSVVNFLCDENATLSSPRSASPLTVAGRAQQPVFRDSNKAR